MAFDGESDNNFDFPRHNFHIRKAFDSFQQHLGKSSLQLPYSRLWLTVLLSWTDTASSAHFPPLLYERKPKHKDQGC